MMHHHYRTLEQWLLAGMLLVLGTVLLTAMILVMLWLIEGDNCLVRSGHTCLAWPGVMP